MTAAPVETSALVVWLTVGIESIVDIAQVHQRSASALSPRLLESAFWASRNE